MGEREGEGERRERGEERWKGVGRDLSRDTCTCTCADLRSTCVYVHACVYTKMNLHTSVHMLCNHQKFSLSVSHVLYLIRH